VGGLGGDVVGLVFVDEEAGVGVAGFKEAVVDGCGVETLLEGGNNYVEAFGGNGGAVEFDGVDVLALQGDGVAFVDGAGDGLLLCHAEQLFIGEAFVLLLDGGFVGLAIVFFGSFAGADSADCQGGQHGGYGYSESFHFFA
jgi:hypothetical protein